MSSRLSSVDQSWRILSVGISVLYAILNDHLVRRLSNRSKSTNGSWRKLAGNKRGRPGNVKYAIHKIASVGCVSGSSSSTRSVSSSVGRGLLIGSLESILGPLLLPILLRSRGGWGRLQNAATASGAALLAF